jgi:hypothetical protein
MHACLLHVYDHALLHLLFNVIYARGSVMVLCTCNFIQIEIDLSSCLCHLFGYFHSHFKALEWFPVCWQIASYSYMSSHLAL